MNRIQPASAAQIARSVAAASQITNLPSDLIPPLQDLPSDVAITPMGQGNCNTSAPTAHPIDCVYGKKKAAKTVVLFGDSHAGMWLPAMNLAAERAGWRMILLFRPDCPVPSVHVFDVGAGKPDTKCDAWRVWAIKHIQHLRPNLVVATSMFRFPVDFSRKTILEPTWDAGLKMVIQELRRSGTRVVVVGDIPYLRQNAADCLAAHSHDVQACSSPRGTYRAPEAVIPVHDASEQRAAESAGASYVNIVPWFCSASRCFAVIGRIGVYRNEGHISATYARWLSSVLGKAVGLLAP